MICCSCQTVGLPRMLTVVLRLTILLWHRLYS